MPLAFMSFGFAELLLVGIIALLVFGGNLPDVMRTLGRSYAKFRQSLHEFSRPVRQEMRELTRLPPSDAPPVPRDGEPDEVPEYPDHYETADAEDGGPTEPKELAPAPPDELEIDEPPPV